MDQQELLKQLNSRNIENINRAFYYLDEKARLPFQRWSYFWNWRKFITIEDIDDVYQESLIVFYNWVLRYGAEKIKVSPMTFLFGIAKKKWKEHFRKNQLWKKMKDVPGFIDRLWEFDADKETKLEDLELYFKELSGSCKEILTLSYFLGMNCQEIVQEIPTLSVVNCRQKRFMCIEKMRQHLGVKKTKL